MIRRRSRARRVLHAGNPEAGMALILAMVFMLIMALITVALGNLAVSELAAARSLDTGTRALAVADGAIERAVAFLKLAPDWSDTNNPLLKNLDTTGLNFRPMYDTVAKANATNQAFPVSSSFGTYTIEFKEASSTNPNVNHDNIWVRALGTYGGVARSIEAYVERLTPANVGGGPGRVFRGVVQHGDERQRQHDVPRLRLFLQRRPAEGRRRGRRVQRPRHQHRRYGAVPQPAVGARHARYEQGQRQHR